jgi:hypothetical protein
LSGSPWGLADPTIAARDAELAHTMIRLCTTRNRVYPILLLTLPRHAPELTAWITRVARLHHFGWHVRSLMAATTGGGVGAARELMRQDARLDLNRPAPGPATPMIVLDATFIGVGRCIHLMVQMSRAEQAGTSSRVVAAHDAAGRCSAVDVARTVIALGIATYRTRHVRAFNQHSRRA